MALNKIEKAIASKDEKKLQALLKNFVKQHSDSEEISKFSFVFEAFEKLLSSKEESDKRLEHTNYLTKMIFDQNEAKKEIDNSLVDLRQKKKSFEEEKKYIISTRGKDDDRGKIAKDLENLDKLYNLIIDHYEGEYEHKKRSRSKLKRGIYTTSVMTEEDGGLNRSRMSSSKLDPSQIHPISLFAREAESRILKEKE